MGLFSDADRAFARAIAKLSYGNPFGPERIQHEREALGDAFIPSEPVWNVRPGTGGERPNVLKLKERCEAAAPIAWSKLVAGHRVTQEELQLYQDLIIYLLYHRSNERFNEMIRGDRSTTRRVEFYREFRNDFEQFLRIPGIDLTPRYEAHHLFASFYQIRRAFHHIFRNIVGASMPAARLRSAVWQSISTNDRQRYQRVLYDRMADFTTLIIGPSGTGKELVARAVAMSRYIPFDEKSCTFTEDFRTLFHPLNISALSPTLIESELFGHRRGAFTGALEDRVGWLEICSPLGSVFLDEVGEIDAAIQVKLLRVLQTRMFQRLGDTSARHFQGKIIAATNRDLAREMHAGSFRQDFYYRLCSDVIVTPSLCEILQGGDWEQELRNMAMFIAQRITAAYHPDDDGKTCSHPAQHPAVQEAEAVVEEVIQWIAKNLGRDYAWPGNFRELEQCLRNVLIRGEYRPALLAHRGEAKDFAEAIATASLTADELLKRYCTLVYAQTGSYQETARRLGLDRRTVRSRVEPEAAEEIREE